MDRLLAVNEGMAVYYHDESTPAKRIDPFKYINELLSIRSAKGLVSFLQQYPDELVVMHEATAFKSDFDNGYVVGGYKVRQLKTRKSKRSLLYGVLEEDKGKTEEVPSDSTPEEESEPFVYRFAFGENAIMNAAAEFNVDYFDALTDLEKYTHYGEALSSWQETLPKSTDQWTAEDTKQYYLASQTKPKPELRIVFIRELELLSQKLSALLELAALSNGVAMYDGLFEFEHVNEPMGLCLGRFPEWLVGNLLPLKESIFAIDNLHQDYYTHATNRLHFNDEKGLYVLAHTNDEDLASRDIAGVIVSFVLSEWSNFYNKTDTMSFDVNWGYQLYEQKNNEVVTELCRIIAEGRVGICPVCQRPFVVKRRPINGVINKRFCTNSCKVKGHVESKGGEKPTA